MEKIRSSLAKRATGFPARLLYDPAMPQEVLRAIKQKTGITDEELVEGSRYHNFRDFFGFPDFGEADFHYPPRPALPHPTLPRTGSLLAAIGQRDHLLHPPYQSFDYVTAPAARSRPRPARVGHQHHALPRGQQKRSGESPAQSRQARQAGDGGDGAEGPFR